MKIGVLLRGFHYLEKDRFGFPLDGRNYVTSLFENVITPLREKHEVKIYASTYPSPIWKELESRIIPDASQLLDPQTTRQVQAYEKAVSLVESHEIPDRLVCLRFDLKYLKPINQWNIWSSRGNLYFPWKEYSEGTQEPAGPFVGDAVHVVDREALELFKEGLKRLIARNTMNDLHGLWQVLGSDEKVLRLIEAGSFDSNTLFYGSSPNRNPLYVIGNRPRLCLPAYYHPCWQLKLGNFPALSRVMNEIIDSSSRLTIKGVAAFYRSLR